MICKHDKLERQCETCYWEKEAKELEQKEKLLLEQIADKDREIAWLRQDRESLEGRLAMWKGYDA